ncbi:MAG: hypothetical protein M3429_09195 [Verrucomicrobiota bacterium]|nr:hypothetical protein [Verrucomicrobiota bacterium]
MVSPDAAKSVSNGRVRLTILVAAAVLLPALVSHLIPARRDFDPKPIKHLQKQQPEVVMIGDSVLGGSINAELFAQETGLRSVELLWNGGAASAAWYLLLKNYVVAAEIQPQLVCIFFRERMLTDAAFRTNPTYRRFLESLRHQKEPVYRMVLQSDEENKSALGRAIDWLYPLNTRRHVQQEKISRLAFRVAAGGVSIGPLRRRVNEIFDPVKLREEIMNESAELSGEAPEEFTADPKRNFLPHIVDAAKQAGLKLCFVREKRYPLPDGTTPQPEDIQRYTADLRQWLESQGCLFVDLTSNLTPDQSMYTKPGDDHIRKGAKDEATKIYAEKLRPLLRQP